MLTMLRTNRDIRLLFIAQVVSFLGDWFAYVAFVGLVQDVSDRSVLVTMVLVAQSLPAFLVTPIAGPVADRYDRKKVISVVSAVQAVAAIGLLVVDSVSTLWIGFVCLCAISALGAFVGPAAQAALPNLARSDDELTKASALFGALWGVMLAVGAALGGVVAGVFGRDVAFIVNALSFAIAAIAVVMVKRPMQAATSEHVRRDRMRPIADMIEALSHARRDSVLLALFASKATFAMGAGIVGLLAVLVTEELDGGDTATGLLIGVRGVGVAIGPIIAFRFVGAALGPVLRVCGWGGVVFGVSYLALSAAPGIAVAMAFAFIAHLGGGAQWTLSTYGLQVRSPDAVRGRILAGDFGLVTLVITISNVAAGLLADAIGSRPTIALFAALTIAAAAGYLAATSSIRRRLDATPAPA
ncbi:MAG: MFS transporter [Ilumatobacteraceae bacterium]|jgi:MFS family permease|nr:MFS transporter [Ilumatobacteraceae bacterium]